MDSAEIWQEKQRFLAETERRLRRKLGAAERKLLSAVFERMIDAMGPDASGEIRNPSNLSLIDRLTTIYSEFTKAEIIDVVRDYAQSTMKLTDFAGRYFRAEVQGSPKLTGALAQGEKYLRARLGINPDGSLKAGGYLKAVIDDPTIRDGIRQATYRAIEGGGDLQAIRQAAREYVIGKEGHAGALTKQWERQTFDTLQESDADINTAVATAIGLQGGEYAGGLIETSRVFCCERDGLYFTVDEMKEMGKLEWDGKKSDNVQLHRGGHACRHQWRMVSNARLLRRRPDLMMNKEGKIVPKPGSTAPQLNQGCDERLKEGKRKARERQAAKRAKVKRNRTR